MRDSGFRQLSGYRIMWGSVLDDLPVPTRAERKRAAKFRNDLLDLGFGMVQLSVYLRHAWNREKADSDAREVGELVLEAGRVQILFFTDRQRGLSQIFHGRRRSETLAEKPAQFELF